MTDTNAPLIFFAAGEASGDHYAAALFQRLRARHPELRAIGLGGQESRDAGIETTVDLAEVSVMGLVEVLAHYRHLRRVMDQLIQTLERTRPALVIAIDFQEFNQRLSKAARALGIPVLFFVAPQVWAWRPGRAAKFAQVADHLAVLFDFEVPLFASHGMPTTHVGHPLVDLIGTPPGRSEARDHLGIAASASILIGLLPGSRRSEIRRLLPLLLQAADRMLQQHPEWQFILPIASSLNRADIEQLIDDCAISPELQRVLTLVDGQARIVMAACDALCITSGTATLEAALIGTPMVIVYRASGLTYQIARRMVATNWIGLPNIVAGRDVVPELIQSAATPDAIARQAGALIDQPERAARQRAAFTEIRQHLDGHADGREAGRALDRLADLAEQMLSGRVPPSPA